MSQLRVLLVGRHLWPHGSHDSAGALFQLALGLHRRGVNVEILTPRYAASWPQTMKLREIPVHRPAAAPRSEWSMGRYVRHLTHWLRERGAEYDVMYCDAVREEAMAVVDAGRSLQRPTALRLGGWGELSDMAWWPVSRASRRVHAFARSADRLIVATAAGHRALLSEGFAASQVVRIDRGFASGVVRTPGTRAAARRALVTANGDLATSENTPVIFCIGRMAPAAGMNLLAESLPYLVRRFPDLRVWFLGDGPNRETMYSNLRADGVRASIAMPGSFVDWQDVLVAADLYVQTDHEGLDFFVPSAVEAELPLVMLDDPLVRDAIQVPSGSELDGDIGWYASCSGKSLRLAIRRALEQLPARRRAAAALRRALVRTHPLSDTIEAHARLFEELSRRGGESRSRPSSEAAS